MNTAWINFRIVLYCSLLITWLKQRCCKFKLHCFVDVSLVIFRAINHECAWWIVLTDCKVNSRKNWACAMISPKIKSIPNYFTRFRSILSHVFHGYQTPVLYRISVITRHQIRVRMDSLKISFEINELVMRDKQALPAGEFASNSPKKTNKCKNINFRWNSYPFGQTNSFWACNCLWKFKILIMEWCAVGNEFKWSENKLARVLFTKWKMCRQLFFRRSWEKVF